jgi:nucleolar pre-ribosomal-associated protein 1
LVRPEDQKNAKNWPIQRADHLPGKFRIRLFENSAITSFILAQLAKLYDRVLPENEEADHIPADLLHHFLLAICTRPGVGICFKDRGWYPRESEGDDRTVHTDDEPSTHRTSKIYNKILANLLKSLKVNEDSRQQELALKIMTACPELVARWVRLLLRLFALINLFVLLFSYWSGAALTLEPRLSSKWIANVSFFGSVILLPVPSSSFLLPGSTLFQPSPPPLPTMLENILPSVNTKNNMSKGLQSASPLVQHCTALALAKCLSKYAEVLNIFHDVQSVLEEDEEDGQWCKRRKEIEREVRRRVPEFQVIVGFSQHKLVDSTTQPSNNIPSSGQMNSMKAALLSESAQRLLWLYHRCLPSLVAEARFDVGKLLLNSIGTTSDEARYISPEEVSNVTGLQTIQELHVLRLLKHSAQFAWSGKSRSWF